MCVTFIAILTEMHNKQSNRNKKKNQRELNQCKHDLFRSVESIRFRCVNFEHVMICGSTRGKFKVQNPFSQSEGSNSRGVSNPIRVSYCDQSLSVVRRPACVVRKHFSSPEHKVLMVSYFDRALSVVRRP